MSYSCCSRYTHVSLSAERRLQSPVPAPSITVDQASGLQYANLLNKVLACLDLQELIFDACVDPGDDYTELSRGLSQVCHYWRTYLLSSPKYWTTIKMRCGDTGTLHSWTKVLLQRSQHLPITVHLHITAAFKPADVKGILVLRTGPIRQLIIESAIDLSPADVWNEFQCLMSEALELFDFRQMDGKRVTTFRRVADRSFTESDTFRLPLTGGIESSHLNWSTWQMRNITSLTLDYMGRGVRIPNRDLSAILSRNVGTLEHLAISDPASMVSSSVLGFPYTVKLPRLTTLSISYVRAASLHSLLESLELPALRAVTLRDVTRVPEPATPKSWWGVIREVDPGTEGGLALLEELQRFKTITHMECHGVRCYTPSIIFEELTLQYLTLIDSDEVLASLICSIPAPRNGWNKNSSPSLTRSAQSLTHLAITSSSDELFTTFLAKRKESRRPPLHFLAVSPCCLHSAYATNIKEGKWDAIDAEVEKRIELAKKETAMLKVIPQPVLGELYNEETADLVKSDGTIDKDGLWELIPDIILGEDSDDEMEAPWPWLATMEPYDSDMEY